MKIEFFAFTQTERFLIIPSIVLELGECECCSDKVVGIALVWGPWAIGVTFQH